MSLEENRTLVRRLYEEGNKKKLAIFDELIAPTCVASLAGIAEPLHGPQALKQTAQVYNTAFPDLQVTVDDMTCEGDKVVVRWTAQGTHKGELMSLAPTGKRLKATGIDIFRITNGKIVAIWGQFDVLSILKQLDVLPTSMVR